MHSHACTHARTHARTRTRTHTHTHTHTLQQCLLVLLNLLVKYIMIKIAANQERHIFTDNKEKNRISYSFRLYSHIAIEQSFMMYEMIIAYNTVMSVLGIEDI